MGKLAEWWSNQWFRWLHGNHLVYNACWEDPRLDREALQLGPNDTVAVITSAGCNVLDYALAGPKRVLAVDVNGRQNALLELKIAGIRTLDHDTFFSLFGLGRLPDFDHVYRRSLRPELSLAAREYWDRHGRYFRGPRWRASFYFHGTAGLFARMVNFYIDRVANVRDAVTALLNASTMEEQRDIYLGRLRADFWKRYLQWLVGRDTTLSFVGVPRAQRLQVDRHYAGGIGQFIQDCCEAVFARLPLQDNYFWRVYLTGSYGANCCPEYLKAENFQRLKAGMVERITIHTSTLLDHLNRFEVEVSRYVLLDHMDWLSSHATPVLAAEWQAIVDRASSDARVIWRSGGLKVDYVDPLRVRRLGETVAVGEILRYHHDQAASLHKLDRVHTYGSFYVADLAL